MWDNVKLLRKMIRRIGIRNTFRLLAQRFGSAGKAGDSNYHVRRRGIPHPLYLRPHSSDAHVYWEVFVAREYSCLDEVRDVCLIVDCGAYVGYSAIYLLQKYPEARLIAVEPDPGNFAVLQKNLAPYADRVRLYRTAIWSRPVGMKVSDAPYRDGREWAKQFRVCQPGEEADFTSIDIGTLLAESNCPTISILKIDVEGAEVELFSQNYEGWIDKVDHMVIELHDEAARQTWTRAVSGRQFEVTETNFLGVCTRRASVGQLASATSTGG